jgi:hypothetical protein
VTSTKYSRGYYCLCDTGFAGSLCNKIIPWHCARGPCRNGGRCSERISDGYWKCTCSRFYWGVCCTEALDGTSAAPITSGEELEIASELEVAQTAALAETDSEEQQVDSSGVDATAIGAAVGVIAGVVVFVVFGVVAVMRMRSAQSSVQVAKDEKTAADAVGVVRRLGSSSSSGALGGDATAQDEDTDDNVSDVGRPDTASSLPRLESSFASRRGSGAHSGEGANLPSGLDLVAAARASTTAGILNLYGRHRSEAALGTVSLLPDTDGSLVSNDGSMTRSVLRRGSSGLSGDDASVVGGSLHRSVSSRRSLRRLSSAPLDGSGSGGAAWQSQVAARSAASLVADEAHGNDAEPVRKRKEAWSRSSSRTPSQSRVEQRTDELFVDDEMLRTSDL